MDDAPNPHVIEQTILKAIFTGLTEADCAKLTAAEAKEVFRRLTEIAGELARMLEAN